VKPAAPLDGIDGMATLPIRHELTTPMFPADVIRGDAEGTDRRVADVEELQSVIDDANKNKLY
jgi:hypothetical protein